MTAPAITVGAGQNRPQGRRVPLPEGQSPAIGLLKALQDLPATPDSWWSPHIFQGDYRSGENWRGSAAIAVDGDHVDETGKHVPWDKEGEEEILAAILEAELPGSSGHLTPRGVRLLFPLSELVTDAAEWKRAAEGACALAQEVFSRIAKIRIEVDRAASTDIARFFWAPRTSVAGVARNAQVHLMRDRAWTLEELAAHAPPAAQSVKGGDAIEDMIPEGKRHETLKHLAASFRAKGLRAPEIYDALQSVNRHRCKPLYPDKELRQLAGYFGGKDGADLAGKPPDLERFSSIAIGMHAFLKKKIEKPLSVLGDGAISAFHVAMLVGRGGAGKSWLALMLGRAIARGESFFGLATPEGGVKVGILELEDHAYDYQQRLAAIAAATGGSDELDDRLEIVTRPDLQGSVRVGDPDTVEALVHWIKTSDLKVLIVDALKDAHTSEENSNQQMAELMGTFALICFRTGCAIVILHHESSKTPADGKERDDAASPRGASALFDNARCLMRLKIHPTGLRSLAFGKVSHGAPPAKIWLAQDKETGVFTLAEAPQEVKSKNVEKVQSALREAGRNGLTIEGLKEETRLSKSTLHEHLKTLKAESNRGNPPRYRLPSEASESAPSDEGTTNTNNSLDNSGPPASESDWNPPSGVRTVRPKGRNGRTDARTDSGLPDKQHNLPFSADGTP